MEPKHHSTPQPPRPSYREPSSLLDSLTPPFPPLAFPAEAPFPLRQQQSQSVIEYPPFPKYEDEDEQGRDRQTHSSATTTPQPPRRAISTPRPSDPESQPPRPPSFPQPSLLQSWSTLPSDLLPLFYFLLLFLWSAITIHTRKHRSPYLCHPSSYLAALVNYLPALCFAKALSIGMANRSREVRWTGRMRVVVAWVEAVSDVASSGLGLCMGAALGSQHEAFCERYFQGRGGAGQAV